MASVTSRSDFGAQENKICHCFHFFPFCLPWSDRTGCNDLHFFECWVLSQIFHSPLSLSSIGSLVPLYFLPLEWYLHIWGCWYFSWRSWFHYGRKAFLNFATFLGLHLFWRATYGKSCEYFSPVNLPVSIFVLFKFKIQSEILQCICHVSLFSYNLEMLLSFFFFFLIFH